MNSFRLEWGELSEDLREEKIDQLIKADFEAGEFPEHLQLDDVLQDQMERSRAEEQIEARFSIYF